LTSAGALAGHARCCRRRRFGICPDPRLVDLAPDASTFPGRSPTRSIPVKPRCRAVRWTALQWRSPVLSAPLTSFGRSSRKC